MQECTRNWLKSEQEPSVLCGQEKSGRSDANCKLTSAECRNMQYIELLSDLEQCSAMFREVQYI